MLLRLPARQLAATDPPGMVSLNKPVAAHVGAAMGNNMAKTAKEETVRRPASQRPPQRNNLIRMRVYIPAIAASADRSEDLC